MDNCFDRENETFIVLMNHEKQYSLWPAWKEVPGGWEHTGKQGNKQECLAYVDEQWTDMRPQSLRDWMSEQEK